MTDEILNTLVVLGHRLLLVDVGGGFETHLCEATSDSTACAALDTRQPLPDSLADALERGGDDDRLDALLDGLLDTAWKPTTLCGRAWDEMAAGEAGTFRRWQEIELTPTCRSCLRVVDTWFPRSGSLPAIGVLVSVIGEKVEAFARRRPHHHHPPRRENLTVGLERLRPPTTPEREVAAIPTRFRLQPGSGVLGDALQRCLTMRPTGRRRR